MIRIRSTIRFWLLAVTVGLWPGERALACAVCYGAAKAPILDGMAVSILFLLGVTYLVIASLLAGFFLVKQKNRVTQGSRKNNFPESVYEPAMAEGEKG